MSRECHEELAACFDSPTMYHHAGGHIVPTDPDGVAAMTTFLLSFARVPIPENELGAEGVEVAVAPKEQIKHLIGAPSADTDSKSDAASAVLPMQIESTTSLFGNVCISGDNTTAPAPLSARQVASCIRSAAAAGGGRGRALVRGELQDQALYDHYRAIWNGMHDRHPGVIVVATQVSARE